MILGTLSRPSSPVLQHSRNSRSCACQLLLNPSRSSLFFCAVARVSSFRSQASASPLEVISTGVDLSLSQCFHLETQSHLSLMCSLTQLTCVSRLWPSTTTQSSVHTHAVAHDVVFPITSQILEPMHTSLHVRVVGRWSGCDPCPHPGPSPLPIFPDSFPQSVCFTQ